ncbi:MAG TPA: FG-GAP-like repeat-containing protein [Pirellulaceae bacterium]|nr:FG-GAP-like repeat-containing protein [Pirellulaceae bacterium]
MRHALFALLSPIMLAAPYVSSQAAEPEISSVVKIWDRAPHNAFTDLIRFRDSWWCTFREGKGHAGDNGKVQVIVAADGVKWESAALIAQDGIDLRDPKLSIMPDGRLMLIMGGSVHDDKGTYQTRSPRVAFSQDGHRWTEPQKLLDEDHWLWRVTWHKGKGYSVSKLGNGRDPRRVMLYRTADGIRWELLTEFRDIPAWPNEATIRFLDDDEMVVLLRRNKTAWIGTSRSPYTEWKWKDSGHQIGGPNFIRLPDDSLWAAGRRYGDKPTTVLARMTRNSYEPVLSLPSGGDCSYPGMVWHNGLLWMSYYSSHEGKTSIYLAKIKVPLPKPSGAPRPVGSTHGLSVTVTSELPGPKVCADPMIDFADEINIAGIKGVLDPNSIEVVNLSTNTVVPHSLSRHFQHGDKGRVRWVINDPKHTDYGIRFRTTEHRPLVRSPKHIPLIGVGDLLHYNAGVPRPIGGLTTLSRFADLMGDGREDLIFAGMYTYESRWPEMRIPQDWGGIFCRPRVGNTEQYLFGEMIRLRYKMRRDTSEFHDFSTGYMHADVADLNRDGLPDLLFTTAVKSSEPSHIKNVHQDVHFFLNSGDRDDGGMPIFIATGRTPHPDGWWGPVRAVDLNGDTAIDLVFGSMYRDSASARPDTSAYYVKNQNPQGWPFEAAKPVQLEVGRRPCFYDVDRDGRLDSVCLIHDQRAKRFNVSGRMGWRRNQGGDPPRFGAAKVLEEIDLAHCYFTAAVRGDSGQGVIVSYDAWQRAAFLEQKQKTVASTSGRPRFVVRDMLSHSAELALGDQATPFPCDWDDDGDWDLLVGGGYGHVRILINAGTNARPQFETVRAVLAHGEPIVIHMSTVFPGLDEYGHNMGYPHPAFVDWDADGRRDLMVPNITNRIFWYKNVGTPKEPRFGPRRQVVCDGFPESGMTLHATARLLGAETKQWTKRVPDPNSPFGWRSRAGFGDFNGDGLMDMVTTDAQGPSAPNGYAEQSALFVQWRDGRGELRLRRDHVITLPDGSPMKNVGGQPAQTIPVDWDSDGRLDLIINHGRTMDTAPALVRNIGTTTDPRFDYPKRLKCWGIELSGIAKHGPYYGVGDLDDDGKPDLLACPEMGTYHFFRRTALDMPRRPSIMIGSSIIGSDEER